MGKNSIMDLFKGATETTSGEELLYAAIEIAKELRADIKAAYEKEIQDVVGAINKYKADAEKLLQNVRDDVGRRSGKIVSLKEQKELFAAQIQELNTQLGEAMVNGTEADQDKILEEIQRLNLKMSAVDGMVKTFATTAYSLSESDRALADSLQEQAAEILDMIYRGNSLFNTFRGCIEDLDIRRGDGVLADDYLFLYGSAAINHVLPVDHARCMPRALDLPRIKFFQSPVLTLGSVLQHLEEDDKAPEVVSGSFSNERKSVYPW